MPGLREQKDGKFVIFTVEEDFGRAIVECSQNTWCDEGIITKAARIVRRFLFTKEEPFEGDLSKQRQKASVPLPLLDLVSLIGLVFLKDQALFSTEKQQLKMHRPMLKQWQQSEDVMDF